MVREAFLAGALLFGSRSSAQAPPNSALATAGPGTPYVALEEHRLRPVDAGAPLPADDERLSPMPEWSWPREHLEAGRAFADPFIGPEVYPELSAGIQLRGALADSGRALAYDQQVALNLYLVEIKFPLMAERGGSVGANPVFIDAKIPLELNPSHRLAFVWGVALPNGAPAQAKSSRGEVLYAFGGGALSLQLKVGYGYEPLFRGDPLCQAVLLGGFAGLRLGPLQPVLQVEGSRALSARRTRVALAPGLWVFPLSKDAVQLGVSALVVLNGSEPEPSRRVGAVASVGYNFL